MLFFLSFAALMVLLHLAARAVDLMMKLPVLHTANALLGGVIGLAEAVVLIYLALWLIPRLGWGISTETQEASTLLAFFSDHAPFETFGLFL